MEIKILKGTNQIGGAFTEITTKKGRIIIDFGQDLDNEKKMEEIEGLTKGKKAYDGVIITHNHQDHMGRINEINKEIPVYFSNLSRKKRKIKEYYIQEILEDMDIKVLF